jgi:CheY-like chemotaxis protein
MLLSKHNLKIDEASSGAECLEKMKDYKLNNQECVNNCLNYSLILMDIDMPQMDGLQTTTKIRKLYGPKILIYGLSGYSDLSEKYKCLSVGMNQYFTKPLKISDFISELKAL